MFEYKTAQVTNIIIEYLFSPTLNIFNVCCFSLHKIYKGMVTQSSTRILLHTKLKNCVTPFT